MQRNSSFSFYLFYIKHLNSCSNIQYNNDGVKKMTNEELEKELEIDDYIEDMADLFKILGDKTRTKILASLEKGEKNVSSISEVVGLPISAISHQLRTLRQAKLIKPKKVGKEVFYSLDDDHVSMIFECALAHVKE